MLEVKRQFEKFTLIRLRSPFFFGESDERLEVEELRKAIKRLEERSPGLKM
ncbi:MAG: hypothetical protein J7L17_04205 [Thaumarchaeota archaeon]|nr:hypothetical protein [Nitrososphaerota archaeon]